MIRSLRSRVRSEYLTILASIIVDEEKRRGQGGLGERTPLALDVRSNVRGSIRFVAIDSRL